MRMIVEFEKMGRMSWFSHLDLQSTMQRALRRAGLPVRYSKGFSPHVNLAFATALPVGCQSTCEMMDVELSQDADAQDFLTRLNACLPEGLRAHRAAPVEDGAPALMAILTAARYEVTVRGADLSQAVRGFAAAEQVVVEKRSKSGVRPTDIKPLVQALDCAFDGETSTVRATLTQTNSASLKIELLMQALAPERHAVCVRTGLLAGEIDLFDAAQVRA